MKDWSDLEERYQDMRAEDPTSAEDFKKQMTERFQKTVQVGDQIILAGCVLNDNETLLIGS